jgi:hypothetical protein
MPTKPALEKSAPKKAPKRAISPEILALIEANRKSTDKILAAMRQELNAQSNGAGRITENLMAQGMKKALDKKFGERFDIRLAYPGQVPEGAFEIDVLASSSRHIVVVEVKNTTNDDALVQLNRTLTRFPKDKDFNFRNRVILGAIASTRIDRNFLAKAQAAGVLCFEIGPHNLVQEATIETAAAQGRALGKPRTPKPKAD